MVEVTFSSWSSKPIQSNSSTYVITHGYLSSSSDAWVDNMASEISQRDPTANIILTDWSDAADNVNYFSAVNDTEDVGEQVANWLQDEGINPNTTQLVGHSLGAHVAGIAADRYSDLTGASVDTVVGLDPAGPVYEEVLFYSGKPAEERLDPTDANRVVAFHTSDTFGYDDSLGTLDIYVNPDSLFQPGQNNALDNHRYAYKIYTDLIGGNGYIQENSQTLGDGIFDYEDILVFGGDIDVDTTDSVALG